jgi:glycosyltransferase involved in cell wall biosynthesis
VRIVHSADVDPSATFGVRSRQAFRVARDRRRHAGGRPDWFPLDTRVEVMLVPDLGPRRVPDGDAIFATACTTAPAVAKLGLQKGAQLYLVQGYEDWMCGKEAVDATWRLAMHKVVSSRWLLEIGQRLGEGDRVSYSPIGVELETFRLLAPIGARPSHRIAIAVHDAPLKGLREGLDALERTRRTIGHLEVVAFGVMPRPPSLPLWIQYVENPSRARLVELYNSVAIFLHSSLSEGWSLPPAEAAACGCALAAFDSGGVRDYAVDGETAMLVPAGDSAGLAERVIELLADHTLRRRLAVAAHDVVQEFTWQRAGERLEAILLRIVGRALDVTS